MLWKYNHGHVCAERSPHCDVTAAKDVRPARACAAPLKLFSIVLFLIRIHNDNVFTNLASIFLFSSFSVSRLVLSLLYFRIIV